MALNGGMQMSETENKNLQVIDNFKDQLIKYLDIAGVGIQLTRQEKENFIQIAMAYKLSPFKREIYCTTYGQGQYRKTSIITGYEVYIKRAERTGKLNGWGVEIKNAETQDKMSAVITIYRKDWDRPFTHEVFFNEAAQKTKEGALNSIWAKMPRFMLRKVAIAQGFRLCFSDELGGMPYTADELPQGEIKARLPEAGAAQAAEPEIIEPQEALPEEVLEVLAKAKTRAELKALMQDCVKNNDEWKPALTEYYKKSPLK
jgi:phage recombination protein Bet